MRRAFALLGLLVVLLGAAPEDPLDLPALLVRDGHWDRAAAALAEVDPAGDPLRFHTLRGLVRQNGQDWAGAAADFRAAIDAGVAAQQPVDPVLYLQLAQALVGDGRPVEALVVLDGVPDAARGLSATWLIEARAAWLAGDSARSWQALDGGAAAFPDVIDFPRQQVLLLAELGLYQEASERGSALLARPDATPGDVLAIAEALRRGGAVERAVIVVGEGRLRFPGSADLWAQSAALSLAQGRYAEAGDLLVVAAEIDPKYALEAAECYRKAGRVERALYLNGQVADGPEKAKQRLGILLETEQWEQALALQPRIERLDLLGDASVAYGLAYARFMIRDHAGSEALLKRISDPAVFQTANELRAAMAACDADPGACP